MAIMLRCCLCDLALQERGIIQIKGKGEMKVSPPQCLYVGHAHTHMLILSAAQYFCCLKQQEHGLPLLHGNTHTLPTS